MSSLSSRPTRTRSGFMGFGWRALAVIPGYPWWQSLMSRGVLQEPLFGLYVAR